MLKCFNYEIRSIFKEKHIEFSTSTRQVCWSFWLNDWWKKIKVRARFVTTRCKVVCVFCELCLETFFPEWLVRQHRQKKSQWNRKSLNWWSAAFFRLFGPIKRTLRLSSGPALVWQTATKVAQQDRFSTYEIAKTANVNVTTKNTQCAQGGRWKKMPSIFEEREKERGISECFIKMTTKTNTIEQIAFRYLWWAQKLRLM